MTIVKRIDADSCSVDAITDELEKEKWETLENSADFDCLLNFLLDESNYLLFAYEGKEVAGMLTAHELAKLDPRKLEIMLYEIEVKEKFRKRGIGKILIEALLKLAKKRGAYEVWVLTEQNNFPANKLYASIGDLVTKREQVMYSFSLKNSCYLLL